MTFDPGSMAPKVAAACGFAERTGRIAAIGALDQAEAILAGQAGTLSARRMAARRVIDDGLALKRAIEVGPAS